MRVRVRLSVASLATRVADAIDDSMSLIAERAWMATPSYLLWSSSIAMDELHNRYDGVAIQARSAIKDIESSIASATRVAREATESLTRTLIHLHWTSVFLGALILFLAGFGLGMSFR